MDGSTVKLQFPSKLNEKTPVFIADFACGKLNDNDMELTCHKSETDTNNGIKTAKLILNAKGKHLSYTSSSDDKRDNAPVRYFIGVRNKNMGKMELYDSTIFNLKPIFPTVVQSVIQTEKSTGNDYWEKRQQLTEEFGSKSSVRALKIQKKLSVAEQDISLEEALQESSIYELPSLVGELSLAASYLPSLNRAAVTVDEVFDVNDIISPDEDNYLQNQVAGWLNTYLSDPVASNSNLCLFVSLIIDDVLDDPIKLKYLLYYNYLVAFQHLTLVDLRRRTPPSQIPLFFFNHLLKKFTSFSKNSAGKDVRVMSSQSKDRLLACILILALLISNYVANINLIVTDLKKVTAKHFITIAQTLGCYIIPQKREGKSIKFVELRLPLYSAPLKFPK